MEGQNDKIEYMEKALAALHQQLKDKEMAEGSYNASLHPKMEEHVPWPFQLYVGVMIYFFLLILGKYVRQYKVMNVVVVVGRHGLHLEYLNFFYSRVMNAQTNSSFLDCISILFRFFPLLLIYNRTHFGKKKGVQSPKNNIL